LIWTQTFYSLAFASFFSLSYLFSFDFYSLMKEVRPKASLSGSDG
jgi:hypothetical protein